MLLYNSMATKRLVPVTMHILRTTTHVRVVNARGQTVRAQISPHFNYDEVAGISNVTFEVSSFRFLNKGSSL